MKATITPRNSLRSFLLSKSLYLIIAFVFLGALNEISAQCSTPATRNGNTVILGSNLGVGSSTSFWVTSNTYFVIENVYSGRNIRVSTCGCGFDSQLTLRDWSTDTQLGYNDDNGPACTGTASSIDYSGNSSYPHVKVILNKYNCDATTSYSAYVTVTYVSENLAPSSPSSVSVSNSSICNGSGTTLTANGAVGTVYWYTGGCGSSYYTTGNPITVYPSSTTTYYARNYNNSNFSSSCASATVSVTSAPSAPSSASGSATSSTGANISWSSMSGASSYYWVVSTSNTATYGTGSWYGNTASTSTTVSGLSPNTTYYLRVYAYNSCGSSGYTTSSAFTTYPSDPTSVSVTNSTVCSGTSTTLTANGASGTVYWYSGSCGGTYINTGNTLTVSPSSTTTYYARNYNGNFSSGCASATVTVNALPTLAAITGTTSVCVGNTTTLANSQAGGTWSSASTSKATVDPSTGVVTGVSEGTSVITYSYTNGNGCTNSVTTTVTVNALPGAPSSVTATPSTVCANSTSNLNATSTGNAINWYTAATGGTLLGTSASGVNFAVTPSSSTTYYAEAATVTSGSQTISYSGSATTWTVPAGVTSVTIDAYGAQGGVSSSGHTGGLGANIRGTFTVTPGEVLSVVVGGQGTFYGSQSGTAGGGGGGTFVWRSSSVTEPMIVAGGGGGAYGTSPGANGLSASTSTSGVAATNGAAGGTGGYGAGTSNSYGGGGGTGWKSDGTSNGAPGNDGGKSRTNSFAGGIGYSSYGGNGGFGGGGGSTHGGGGGGGYSGGGGGNNSASPGGGGGSYNAGTNTSATAASRSGHGQVIFSWNSPNASSCTSASRTAVTVTVSPSASVASVSGTSPLSIGGTATYTANSAVLSGGTGAWSSSNTNVATVNASSGLVTAVAGGTCNIIYTITGGCGGTVSAQQSLTVNALPTISSHPSTAVQNVCQNSTATALTVTASAGSGTISSYQWYRNTSNANTGGTAVGTNSASYTPPTASASAYYYYCVVTNSNGGTCTSNVSGKVTVTALPAVPTSVTASPTSVCSGSSATLNATSTGNMIYWYTSATGGSSIGSSASGANFVVNPTQPTTYYAEAQTISTSSGTQTFNYTGSIDNFTVPAGVTSLVIEAKGAQGGTSNGSGTNEGGRGAYIKGTVTVTPGQVLKVLVGGQGGTGYQGGGGGGSFVTTNTNSPLVIAGGGGGGYYGSYSTNAAYANGTTSSNGVNGIGGYSGSGGTGGTGGNGGGISSTWSTSGAGGAGLTGNGTNAGIATGGQSFTNGGAGGSKAGSGGNGGFGGGGGGDWYSMTGGGGGGGYSGGGGGTYYGVGGGGGSYNAGTSKTETAGYQTGNGQVIISWTVASSASCTSASRTAVSVGINTSASVASVTGAAGICVGSTSTYTANTVVLAGGTGAWSSSNSSVATVVSSTGVVTAVAAGTCNIVYTITNGCGGTVSASKSITVYALPVLAGITGTTSLCVGNQSTLSNSTAGGTWSSASTNVATINSTTGVVTAVAAGTSVITYTYTNANECSRSVTTTVTVSAGLPVPTSVTASPATILSGASSNLSAVSTNNEIKWYTAATAGTLLATKASGAAFSVSPTTTTTYYAESSPVSCAENSLANILTNLNANYTNITSQVPNKYAFIDGISGNSISDGGSDMYDGGNLLSTNNSSNFNYSDNAITTSTVFGSNGRYFTRKVDNLFVLAADMNNVSYFDVNGNYGSDGGGNTDAGSFNVTVGCTTFNCFISRVYNASDPSINELFIVPANPSVTQTAIGNTGVSNHRLNNLSASTRMYYLLYAGSNGGYINNTSAQSIASAFLQQTQAVITNSSAGCPSATRVPVTVTVNSKPTVTTDAISSIGSTTSTGGGNVTSDGGSTVTARGVCWSTSSNPTISNSKTTNSTGTGTFTSSITGLTAGTTYYVRAYATNAMGTSYGEQVSFVPFTLGTFANISKTYGNPAFVLVNPTSTSTGAFSYESSNTNVATISGNTVTITGAGTSTITCTQAATSAYAVATKTVTLTVAKANQVLTLNPLPSSAPLSTLIGEPQLITASSSAGLTVTPSIASGPASVSFTSPNYYLTPSGTTGTVVVQVNQAGNDNYNAAQISHSIDVTKGNQTITFAALDAVTYSNGLTVDLTASASSSLAVTFTVVSGPATLSGNRLTITGAGTVVVTASQSGNSNWNAATEVTRNLTVNKAAATISLANITKSYGDDDFTLNASSASSGAFTYSSGTTATATISGNTAHIVGAGTSTITVNQAASADYAAGSATALLTVNKANQTISIEPIADILLTDFAANPIQLSATATSGLPVTFTVASGSKATINGSNEAVSTGENGSVTILANQAGDDNYNAATQVSEVFAVNKANQTITFGAIADKYSCGDDFDIEASTNSLLAITYQSSNTDVATISGKTVTIVGAGTTTITASQAGNASYNPASNVQQTLTVNACVAPTVAATTSASSITSSTATSGGNVTADGGSAVIARGVCWSTSSSPTIALSTKTIDANGTGSFTSSLTNLTPGTLYYVRAYATNGINTTYGTQVSFTTLATKTIAVSSNKNIMGTVSGGGTFDAGTSVSVVATANTGFRFVNWTENGDAVSSSTTYTFTASTNRTLVANFEVYVVESYSLEVSATTACVAKDAASSASVTVTSNTNWTASSNQAWLSVSPGASNVSGTLTFTTNSANESSNSRSATVTVSATGATSRSITVTQVGVPAGDLHYRTTNQSCWSNEGQWETSTDGQTWTTYPGKPNTTANSLTVRNDVELPGTEELTAPVINVEPTARLDVKGNITANTKIVINSNETGTGQILNTGTIQNSNATVVLRKSFLSSKGWYFISFPYNVPLSNIKISSNQATATLGNALTAKAPYENLFIIEYDGEKRDRTGQASAVEGQNWAAKISGQLEAGKGYSMRVMSDQTFDFISGTGENALFAADDKSLTVGVYNTNANSVHHSWNLVGVPYSSAFNLDNLNQGSFYYVYNATRNTYTVEERGTSYGIDPFGAFFVQTSSTNMGFAVSGRALRAPKVNNELLYDEIALRLKNNSYSDIAKIRLWSNATTGYEIDKDAVKMFSQNTSVPQLWSKSQVYNLSVNSLPSTTKEVWLNNYIGTTGNYSIEVANPEKLGQFSKVTLVDNVAGTQTDLLSTNSYTFYSATGTSTNRFKIVLQSDISTKTTEISANGIKVSTLKNYVTIHGIVGEALVRIYDAAGKATQNFYKVKDAETLTLQPLTGFYFVEIISDTQHHNEKVFIKK